jgi:DNA repair photolyase
MKVNYVKLKGSVIHDFPYPRERRKCPHSSLISITSSGGCVYQCPYCYARAYPWAKEDTIDVYENLPEKLEEEIKKSFILFPFCISQVTDCLQPVEEVRKTTIDVIKILMKYRLSFHIVTKSAQGPIELLSKIPELIEYPYWWIEITVESTPEKQEVISPYAPPIEERIHTLYEFSKLKLPTVGRTDPTIYGFMERKDILWILDRLKESRVKHIIGSTGYYNKISMLRLLNSIDKSPWHNIRNRVAKSYNFVDSKIDEYPDKIQFRTNWKTRVGFHKFMRREVESRGLTYAVCQELPREYDSSAIPTCEGIARNFVHIKRNGIFYPLNCYGDCERNCPDRENPPCGRKDFLIEYPYKIKSLMTGKRRQLPLFV